MRENCRGLYEKMVRRLSGKNSFDGYLEGSLTVEAALVMSALFLFIAALLTGVFDMHVRTAGNMVLQETLERAVHLEEEQKLSGLVDAAQRDYRGYFWCAGGTITLKKNGNRLNGTAGRQGETSISVKTFNPEDFLRLLRAAGV